MKKINQRLACLFITLFGFTVFSLHGQTTKIVKTGAKRQQEWLRKINPFYDQLTVESRELEWEKSNAVHFYSSDQRDNGWELVSGNEINSVIGFINVSGRVRDIEIIDDSIALVASASGGLWEVRTKSNGQKTHTLLTKEVTSVASGTVAVDPFNKNIILYGTGEPNGFVGTGLFRSEDAGITWQKVTMPKESSRYTEIEFSNVAGKVWCTGQDGAYYSTDNGKTWALKKTGNIWGLAIDKSNPQIAWISEYYGTILKTTNGGSTWKRLSINEGLPDKNVQRIELTTCDASPNVVYAFYSNYDGLTIGIYKSTDGGTSWHKCTIWDANHEISEDIHWGQGFYNRCYFCFTGQRQPCYSRWWMVGLFDRW